MQITDSHDKCVYSNHACQKVLGFTSDELSDRNVWDLQTTIGLSHLVLAENESAVLVHTNTLNHIANATGREKMKSFR